MKHLVFLSASALILAATLAVSCNKGPVVDPKPPVVVVPDLTTTFTVTGLENADVTILSSDGQSFERTLDADGYTEIVPETEITFTKLVAGDDEILVGRRAGGDVTLNFDKTTGKVVLRTAVKSVIPIGTAAELMLLETVPHGLKFLQEDDIDLIGINWKPICSPTRSHNGVAYVYDYNIYFKGDYDGGGHSIHNLTIPESQKQFYASLFGAIGSMQDTGGSVKNLTLASGSVYGLEYAAGIVGRICGGVIENCHNYATVRSETYYSAGVVGQVLAFSTVRDCTNYGAVSAGNIEAGGVVQYAVASTVENCENYGEVSADADAAGILATSNSTTIRGCVNYGLIISSNSSAGGICGTFGSPNALLEKCVNNGTVRVAVTNGGGISGLQQGGIIKNCENNGVIEYTGTETLQNGGVGGIVGTAATGSELIECTNNAEAEIKNAYSRAGGIAGFTTEATVSNCVNLDDISVTYAAVGGIVGENRGNVNGSVNHGRISGESRVGGIVGENFSGMNSARVRICHNLGEVSGESFVGGVIGTNYAICSASVNEGRVIATGEAAGGLVGGLAGPAGYLLASYNTGRVEGADKVGGVAGSMNSNGLIEACYSVGALTGDSNMGGVCGYLEDADSKAVDCFWSNFNGKGIAAGNSTNVCYFDDGTTPAPGVTVGWPAESMTSWAIGNGEGGAFWKDLGEQGTRNYPQLFWQ